MKILVLVDTSCWIASVRQPDGFEFSVLQDLIRKDAVVTSSLIVAELLKGAKGHKEVRFIKDEFSDIPLVNGLDVLGMPIGHLGLKLRQKGYTIGTIDLALSALAIKNNLLLYSLDHHFDTIARVSSLKLFKPLKH